MDKIVEVDIRKISDGRNSHETDDIAVERAMSIRIMPVSYTHLTLPTKA